MHVENILKVADAIEQHSIPDLGFNMNLWFEGDGTYADFSGHRCGTVACIGGTAGLVIEGIKDCNEIDAARILGLGDGDGYDDRAGQLFYPKSIESVDWSKITPAQAARTLRHLAATGTVDWDLPDPTAA